MGRRSLLPEVNYNLIESLNQYQKFSCLKALESKRYFVQFKITLNPRAYTLKKAICKVCLKSIVSEPVVV